MMRAQQRNRDRRRAIPQPSPGGSEDPWTGLRYRRRPERTPKPNQGQQAGLDSDTTTAPKHPPKHADPRAECSDGYLGRGAPTGGFARLAAPESHPVTRSPRRPRASRAKRPRRPGTGLTRGTPPEPTTPPRKGQGIPARPEGDVGGTASECGRPRPASSLSRNSRYWMSSDPIHPFQQQSPQRQDAPHHRSPSSPQARRSGIAAPNTNMAFE